MAGIIFEGADASGKSTLARTVAALSGRDLFLAGGKPRDDLQMWHMIEEQAQALTANRLVDRVSCISQQVYREGLFMRSDLVGELTKLLDAGHVLVYCRPPEHIMLDPSKHEWKPYDTEEWKAQILANQTDYIRRYDLIMSQVPCLIYDWTSEEARHVEEVLGAVDVEGVTDAIRDMIRRPT